MHVRAAGWLKHATSDGWFSVLFPCTNRRSSFTFAVELKRSELSLRDSLS